jgi:PAS domain S-box-containing protein
MARDENEDKLLRSVALQNAQAVLLARERAERELIAAKEALELKSADLAEQREFFRVTLASIGDAVITTDTSGVITFLNPVAESMTGWKAEDAIGQPIEKVFNVINEETRNPAPNPVFKVLREGVAVGLANHTSLIARDRKETPIDDSAAPIRDQSGNISGVVMVFHDVTKQRQLLQSLSEARNHLEKRVQERTAELKTANENLGQLSARVLQARDDEQRRLARELHDSIGQLVAGISMNISVVKKETYKLSPAAAKCVAENAEMLEQVSKEIRTISYLLHPPLLDEAGLGAALQWYVEGFAERSQIKVKIDAPVDLGRLPSDTEIAVFRIIQQCLANIHRHSGSDTADIRIDRRGDYLIVQVQDRGKGMAKEKLRELTESGRSGVGLAGMRERLRQLSGTLEIESDGNGTLVRAIITIG